MSSITRKTLTPLPDQNTPFKSRYQKTSRLSISFPADGRTKQSFKDECDINTIMARYRSTGILPNINELPAQYLDVSEMDYQAHQNFIAGAKTMFGELPSGLRNRFGNDPGAFLAFCSDEKNRPELAEMGLLRPIAEPVIPTPHLTPSTPQNGSNPVSPDGAASPGQKTL